MSYDTGSWKIFSIEEFSKAVGIVVNIDSIEKTVYVDLGGCMGLIPFHTMTWARPFSPQGATKKPRDPTDVLQIGDIIEVYVKEIPRSGKPEQLRRKYAIDYTSIMRDVKK